MKGPPQVDPDEVLAEAQALRWRVGGEVHERFVETVYAEAARLASRAVQRPGQRPRFDLDRELDRVVTSRWWGIPIMLLLFAIVFWITISLANVPSGLLASLLVDTVHPWLKLQMTAWGAPAWLGGLLVDGVYLATAWVISVMLPPMAIFFRCSPCSRTLATCRAWLSIWTMCSGAPALTGNNP
jgi:ferrous iron transport protein B